MYTKILKIKVLQFRRHCVREQVVHVNQTLHDGGAKTEGVCFWTCSEGRHTKDDLVFFRVVADSIALLSSGSKAHEHVLHNRNLTVCVQTNARDHSNSSI